MICVCDMIGSCAYGQMQYCSSRCLVSRRAPPKSHERYLARACTFSARISRHPPADCTFRRTTSGVQRGVSTRVTARHYGMALQWSRGVFPPPTFPIAGGVCTLIEFAHHRAGSWQAAMTPCEGAAALVWLPLSAIHPSRNGPLRVLFRAKSLRPMAPSSQIISRRLLELGGVICRQALKRSPSTKRYAMRAFNARTRVLSISLFIEMPPLRAARHSNGAKAKTMGARVPHLTSKHALAG